ncbi:UNVERIFIED_CONTAM: hypothetical protein GTU68_046436 [Idotea baltica]|nr:hypothetical protein [Idotea baltica]
MILIKSYIVM